jgi:hypothetical protein
MFRVRAVPLSVVYREWLVNHNLDEVWDVNSMKLSLGSKNMHRIQWSSNV